MKSEVLKKSKKVPSIENESYWKKHIAQLSESKLTRKEYCQQYDVNYDRFGYWLGRLRKPVSPPPLIAVKLKSPIQNDSPTPLCSLHLKDGRMLYIHNEQTLMMLLERY